MVTSSTPTKQLTIITGCIFIILLLTAVSFGSSPGMLHFFGLTSLNAEAYFISRISYWICLSLLWLYCVIAEKQKLLLWSEKKYSLKFFASSIFLIFLVLLGGNILIALMVSLFHLSKTSESLSEIIRILSGNMFLLLLTVITAGVVEELIFRGYLLPRFAIIFKSRFWAIGVSSLIFGLMHYKYGTLFNVVGPVFIGVVFAWYYWKYRNIKVVIIAHILWDVMAIYISIAARSHPVSHQLHGTFF